MSVISSKRDQISDADPLEQLRQLREQVEDLLRDRVKPMLSDAVDRAQGVADQATGYVKDEAEVVARQVRDRPITSLVIAAGVGYLLGRFIR